MTAASPMRASTATKRMMDMDVDGLLHWGSLDAAQCRQPGPPLCADCEGPAEAFRPSAGADLHVGRTSGIEIGANGGAHPAHHHLVGDRAAEHDAWPVGVDEQGRRSPTREQS